jgi:hypothetical protein
MEILPECRKMIREFYLNGNSNEYMKATNKEENLTCVNTEQ